MFGAHWAEDEKEEHRHDEIGSHSHWIDEKIIINESDINMFTHWIADSEKYEIVRRPE